MSGIVRSLVVGRAAMCGAGAAMVNPGKGGQLASARASVACAKLDEGGG